MADFPQIDVLTAQQVASVLQVSKNTVYNLAKAGALPSYNVGRKLRFGLDDVQTYIDASKSARQKPACTPPDSRTVAPGGSAQNAGPR